MDTAAIKRAFDERNRAVGELRALHDAAEGREFTAEETQTEERLNASIDEHDAAINGSIALMEREAKADEARAKLDAFATTEAPEAKRSDFDEARDFFLGDGGRAFEARDLVKGVSGDGAELVPSTLYSMVHEYLIHESPILSLCTVLRTSSGEALTIPKVTSVSTAAIEGEADPIAESDPQFSTVVLDAYKYAFMVQVSSELLQDASTNVVEYLARQGGAALGRGVNAHLVSGSGTAQPNGVDNATSGKTAASMTAVTLDEIIDLQHSVPAPYRSNASFLVSDTTLKEIRQLKDTTNQYLWQPSVQAGAPSTFLGAPIYSDPNMGETATGVKAIVYGDLKGYYARFAGPVRIERSDDYGFANDLVTFRFIVRADGDIVDTVGIRTLTMA